MSLRVPWIYSDPMETNKAKSKRLTHCCGYCGSGLSDDSKTVIEDLSDPRDSRFLSPDNYRPELVRKNTVAVKLCTECQGLTRYAARSVWNHILGPDVAARFTDSQLHEAGRSVIFPLYAVRPGSLSGPQKPWAHISPVDARVALADLELEKFDATRTSAHPSGRGCASCGVAKASEWCAAMLNNWPCCADCAGMLNGSFAQGRRIKSLFADELRPSPKNSTTLVEGDILRAWCETADCETHPSGHFARWQYVGIADRESLRRYLVASGYPYCPEDWKRKYRRRVTAEAPARTAEPVGALGSSV